MTDVGRNDPCPCGSGKKYKKCHLRLDEAAPPPPERRAQELHRLDGVVCEELLEFAARSFGRDFGEAAADLILGDDTDGLPPDDPVYGQFLVPWLVYEMRPDGRTVAEHCLAKGGNRFSDAERGWIESQMRSWASIWEVTDLKPDIGVAVRDLLTGAERFVYEVRGSRVLGVRDNLLGRVVDHDGISVFCGMHTRPLPPREAAMVVDLARDLVKVKVRPVAPERLRTESVSAMLPVLWRSTVQEMENRPPPRLQNTDGDLILFTTDHYRISTGGRSEVEGRLCALRGALEPEEDDGRTLITFTKSGNKLHTSWEVTNTGQAEITGSKLTVTSNSVKRANALRKRVEKACTDLIAHLARDHADPMAKRRKRPAAEPRPRERQSPEMLEALRQVKAEHYRDWLDQPIPALDDLTPREAAKRKDMRAQLDLLLREMEHGEGRLPDEERFDVNQIRRALGLGKASRAKPVHQRDGTQIPLPLASVDPQLQG